MQPSTEISIDLTAQELLSPPAPTDIVQVEDIGAVDPALRTGAFAANAQQAAAAESADDPGNSRDSVEIELSAEQIDALLNEAEPR